ncbi:hypothetical protein GCM10011335_03160 [Aureimonas glaciei]|uniref:Uncharacterized protein n=1 Tax=Aureimonas glaciei TaxID=1776957 RepID=A0A917D7N2_9HYPH|nr:hypothetical protein GCM10011335_03160 [Aureimonas glaciei]
MLGDGAWRRPKAWTIAPDGRVTVGKCRAAGVEISAGTMGSGVPGEQDGATVTPAWTAQTRPARLFPRERTGLDPLAPDLCLILASSRAWSTNRCSPRCKSRGLRVPRTMSRRGDADRVVADGGAYWKRRRMFWLDELVMASAW